jgi:hypothetical protein
MEGLYETTDFLGNFQLKRIALKPLFTQIIIEALHETLDFPENSQLKRIALKPIFTQIITGGLHETTERVRLILINCSLIQILHYTTLFIVES